MLVSFWSSTVPYVRRATAAHRHLPQVLVTSRAMVDKVRRQPWHSVCMLTHTTATLEANKDLSVRVITDNSILPVVTPLDYCDGGVSKKHCDRPRENRCAK